MKKLVTAMVLFLMIGIGDYLYTYNNYGSLFDKFEREKHKAEISEEEDNYVYERPERKPMLPEAESDFVNRIDCEKYFSENGDVIYNEEGEYIVSHNVFSNNDGSVTTIDITSAFYENGIFYGKMRSHIVNDTHGGVVTPCAYDSDKRAALQYTYNEHFSLLLDDYNNDGNPDYVFRTGDPEDGGAYYYIEYSTNEYYPCHHTNFLTPKTNSDSAVFVYGRAADSIRLDHTDMQHFFFLTKSDEGIVPYMYTYQFQKCDPSVYIVGERLYSAFYENGELTLKATDCTADMEMYEDTVSVTVRKYNDREWLRCGEFTAEFGSSGYCRLVHSLTHEENLEKGLYRLEINTPDGIAYAEFMVRA